MRAFVFVLERNLFSYLNELDDIIRMGYSPTTDDILRASAYTVGSDEFTFPFRSGLVAK